MISASRDKTIRVWDVGKQILLGEPIMAHDKDITNLVFGRDGKRFFSSSWDKTIKIWNAADQSLIGTLSGHDSFISSLALTEDNQWIASASLDKTIFLWQVGLESWLEQVCRIAHRNLTYQEWRQVIKDEAHRPLCP